MIDENLPVNQPPLSLSDTQIPLSPEPVGASSIPEPTLPPVVSTVSSPTIMATPIPPTPVPPPVSTPSPSFAPTQTTSASSISEKWIWIVVGVVGLITLSVVAFFAIKLLAIKPSSQSLSENIDYSSDSTNNPSTSSSYNEIVIPTPTPLPVTIAPPGTPEWRLEHFRTRRATVQEAQELNKTVGPITGEIQISPTLTFVHDEVYKGIPIRWTSGQPIPSREYEFLKASIDALPPFFVTNHPITGVYSASPEELGITDALNKSRISTAAAFASGLNIFMAQGILSGTYSQKEFEGVFFHEWWHVVQYYEALQTFSDKYLMIPGNATIAISLVPFTKDFAKAVGWEFPYDDAGNSWSGNLKKDAESQKTSDYGKREFYEDQAETAEAFLTCQTSTFSQARIQWMEKATSTKASLYCQ